MKEVQCVSMCFLQVLLFHPTVLSRHAGWMNWKHLEPTHRCACVCIPHTKHAWMDGGREKID